MKAVRIKINAFYTIAQHKHATKIAVFTRRREFKIIFAPKRQLPPRIAFEAELFQEHSLIKELYLHLLAVAFSGFVGDFFYAKRKYPVIGQKREESKPEDIVDVEHE